MDGHDSCRNGNDGRITHEVRSGILWVILTGSVSLPAVTAYATLHQDLWSENSKILWDLRAFDPSGISSQDILNIQHAFAEVMALRPGGRSAVVVGKELDLVARVALALWDDQGSPVNIRSFLDDESACSWLEER